MNAVHHLYQHRKSLSTTTFKARGQKVIRCEICRLAVSFCICNISPSLLTAANSNAGFLLLMYDTEILKPSNTGRLIADLVPDTYAFLWSRTVANPELLKVLADEQWQPFVVFPAQYAEPEREVFQDEILCKTGKRPLFIMLDGSWREAKKMFRKSPYLAHFPVVSFDPSKAIHSSQSQASQQILSDEQVSSDEQSNSETFVEHNDQGEHLTSRYQIRRAGGDNQFATAEVAARVLAMFGEQKNAQVLDLWFDVFSYQYQKSVRQTNKGNPKSLDNYHAFIDELNQ